MLLRNPIPALLVVLLIALCPGYRASGQNPAVSKETQTSQGNELTGLEVVGQVDGIDIEVGVNAQVRPKLMVLTGPDRLVADFPGFRTKSRRIHVGRNPVLSVRTAVFQENPPIARVVIDLQRPVRYELASAENKIVLKLRFRSAAQTAGVARDTTVRLRDSDRPAALSENFSLDRSTGQLTLRIATGAHPITPSVIRLHHPERVVLDFAGMLPGGFPPRILVRDPQLYAIRTALHPGEPVITRVVLDVPNSATPSVVSKENLTTVRLAPPHEEVSAHTDATNAVSRADVPDHIMSPPVAIPKRPAPKLPPLPQEASLPPRTLPRVDLHNGLLTIQAMNSSVAEVMRGIEAATGATFEASNAQTESVLAGPSTTQRVALNLGPGSPREVVSEFLDSLPFNFIIIESQPGRLQKVLLTANTGFFDSVRPSSIDSSQPESSPEVRGDVTPPSVSIESPPQGAAVQGMITVTAQASDDVGVVGVQFTVDGNEIGTEVTSPPYETMLDTSSLKRGVHILAASARDARGNSTTSPSVSINVATPN